MKPNLVPEWTRRLLLGCLALVALMACNLVTTRVGELQTETETVALGDAESVEVKVEMGVGELTVDGGADGLLDATFAYNVADWEPDVDYVVRAGEGQLDIRQPEVSTSGIPDDEIRNAWNLAFSEDVPLEMTVRLGLGESELEFDDLQVSELDITTGAGDTTINVGAQEAGRISVEAGLGDVRLRVPGGSVDDLSVRMGAGAMEIDLRGVWTSDLDAVIGGGLGDLTLRLPRDVGVRVRAQAGLGSIEAAGFSRDGDYYINDAYGDSDVTLEIDIDAGVGTVRLDLGE